MADKPRKKRSRRRKAAIWSLQGLAALVIVLIAVVIFLVATVPGGRMIALIVNRLGSNEVQSVDLAGVTGLISGDTRVEYLVIGDGEGNPWLRLDGIEIDWSPFALFSSGLAIDRLHVEHVNVARLPKGGEEESESSGALNLPLNVNIEDFDLPDILIGEEIAGVEARFSTGGKLKVNSDLSDVDTNITLDRVDGTGGSLRLDANINLPEKRFDLDAELAEPAGGVIARLAGLPENQAINISADTQGTLDDWTLDVTGRIDGNEVATANAKIRARDDGHLFETTARGQIGRFMPPVAADLFEGDSDLFASGLVEPENAGVQVEVFSLDSSSLHAEGQGRLAKEGRSDFTARVTGADGPVRLAFGEGDGRIALALSQLDLAVAGEADAADVTVNATLPSLESAQVTAEDLALHAELPEFDLAARSGSGSATLTAASMGAADATTARALAGEINIASDFTLSGSEFSTTSTTVRSGTVALEFSGDIDTAALTGSGHLEGRMNSAVLAANLPDTIGREVTLSTDLTLPGDNAVSVSNLRIGADALTISGSADLAADKAIAATLAAELENVAALNPLATGSLSVNADISGTVFAPEFEVSVDGTNIAVDGKPVEELKITAEGKLESNNPTADVRISGTYLDKPIVGTATLASQGGRSVIDPLRLQVEDNEISGALTLDGQFRPSGAIDLDLADIGALAALAGVEIAGRGEGRLVFSVEDDIPVLAANLSVPELSGTGYQVNDASLNATIDNYLAEPGVAGTARVDRVSAGKTAIRGITVDVSLADGWTNFTGNATADGSPVDLKGRVRQADGATQVELETARISYSGLPITLSEPAKVSVRNGTAEIGNLVLSPGGGRVSVTGSAGENLDLNVRLNAVPLTVIDAVAPGTGLRGNVSGTVTVEGTASAPIARYDLTADGVSANALVPIDAPPLSVTAKGTYQGDSVNFNATAGGGGLRLNADGSVGLTGAKSLSIKANGTAPFSLVAARLAAQGLVLDGTADVNMSIGGTAASPDYNGTIRSSNARFIDTTSGIAINNIATEIGLDRQNVNLRSLTGELSTGGQLTGSGTIGLDGNAGYPGDLSLRVANGRYADGRLVATRFDADLTVTGPLARQPVLGGRLDLGQTTITVPDALPGSISQLNIDHRNASSEVRAQDARLSSGESSGTGGGLGLDLQINAPRRIFVRGRGIDAEFGGSLTLKGTTANPVAIGGFDLVRGRLDILGKRLEFDSGRIGFAGSMIPNLDFSASTSAGTSTATILVTGPATAPEFDFTSSPALPDDEVLALLVFGRSLSNLSPLQIAQLAGAAAELTGVTSGGGLVGQLRKATGIDNLDVRTNEEGETSVGVGKYLNDRTYFGLEQGTSAGSGRATIDLDVGRGLKLRGSASSDGETKGGIFFERDY